MNISGFSPSGSNYYGSVGNRAERSVAANAEAGKIPPETEKKSGELSPEEANQVAKLKETDRKVRMHEMAHMAAGGGMITSGASYTYQKGPDGVSYATGGEVGIDTSPGRTPEETISRAQRIRAAALAPADPSGQDLAVAAQATQMEQQARMEAAEQRRQENSGQGKVEGYYAGKTSNKTGTQVSTYA